MSAAPQETIEELVGRYVAELRGLLDVIDRRGYIVRCIASRAEPDTLPEQRRVRRDTSAWHGTAGPVNDYALTTCSGDALGKSTPKGSAVRGALTSKSSGGIVKERALALLVVSMLASACSESASVSGHLHITLPSGDVKPGVQLEVFLLRATTALETEWTREVASFTADRAGARASAQEAEATQVRARADQSSAASAGLSALLQKDDVDWRAYDQAAERQRAAMEQLLAAGRQGRDARSRWEKIASQYRQKAWDIIQMHQTQRARTDVNGRFEFKVTAPGRYVLASRFPAVEPDVYWFVPLEVRPRGEHTADLTSRNARWPFP